MLRGVLARASSAMLRRLRGVSVACFAPAKRASGIAAAALLLATLAGGCTRIELENKAEAYDAAISESSNELILLNAVRASQRAPMSFVSLGKINSNPSVGASLSSTFNFERVTGLTNWSAT